MAHGITSTDFMYTTAKAAWHAFETGMPTFDSPAQTWQEARDRAHLNWEPQVVKSYYTKRAEKTTAQDIIIAQTVIEGEVFFVVEDTTGRKVLRDDTESVLGSGVSPDFAPVSNTQFGELAQALADEGATFWTTGSLYEGRKVFVTMRLGEAYRIGNETNTLVVPFLALTNCHDGSGSLLAMPSTFEVVCGNTAKLAEITGEAMGRQFKFNHIGNVMERVDEAKATIAGAGKELERIREESEALYALKISGEQVETFLNEYEPTKPVDEVGATKRVRTNNEKAREGWKDCFFSNKIGDDQRFTALGLFRASTDWADHVRGTRGEYGRPYRSLMGYDDMKTKAAATARLVATR